MNVVFVTEHGLLMFLFFFLHIFVFCLYLPLLIIRYY